MLYTAIRSTLSGMTEQEGPKCYSVGQIQTFVVINIILLITSTATVLPKTTFGFMLNHFD